MRRLLAAIALIALAFAGTLANSQTAPAPAPANRPAAVPEWETLAGGKMSFDVASIRQAKPGTRVPSNILLNSEDFYTPTGGLFSTDASVVTYVNFAYKLWPSADQMEAMVAGLPKWVTTDDFVIQARAPANATKDQMRLMMQSLLADRFQLAVHFETHEIPVLAMVLEKEGKLGAKLRHHEDGPPCDVKSLIEANGPNEILPVICNQIQARAGRQRDERLAGARNEPMATIASFVSVVGHLGRPVVDQTGLTGTFDFTLQFTPDSGLAAQPGTDAAPDFQGTTLVEALKAQLGLKLIRTSAPVETLVIDHIERPSEN